VTAVIWAGLGGTETGNALVDVIYGDKNPSGRLPYTIAKSPDDYPAQLVLGGNGEEILNITYSEGCVPFLFLFFVFQTASFPPAFLKNSHCNCAVISQVVRRLSPF
jgi:glycosyl hydrolase family 3